MVAQLTPHSPTIQASVDLDAKFHVFVGAQACLAGICKGPALGLIDVDASRTLASINRNNDGKIQVGDQPVALRKYCSALDGNLTGRLNIPNIDAVSNASTSVATTLRSFGRDSVLSLDATVGNLVSTDASQRALLYAAGYSPDRIALVSPIGLPNPVPEPASWALMLLGCAAVAKTARSKGHCDPIAP